MKPKEVCNRLEQFLKLEYQRYTLAGLDPPEYTAIELSRKFDTYPRTILTCLKDNPDITITSVEPSPQKVQNATRESITNKRNKFRRPWDIRSTQNASKKIKSFSAIADLQYLKLFDEKTKIKYTPDETNPETLKDIARQEIKQRLSLRWNLRGQYDNETIQPLPENVVKYQEIIKKYGLFTPEGGMTRSFRLSGDIFSITPELIRQMQEMQTGFYGQNGAFSKLGIDPPFLIRLDLGLTPDNKLKIFEVEGNKTNGFGYSACADIVRGPDTVLPGIPNAIARQVRDKSLGIPIGQRFYKPEMIALASILREQGVKVQTLATREEAQRQNCDVLLNWPNDWGNLLVGQSCLIPPNSILDDKRLLCEFQKISALTRYIPETITIERANMNDVGPKVETGDYIIKKAISSGARNVAIDVGKVYEFLKLAVCNPGEYILQEKVPQQKLEFSFIEPSENQLKSESMYTRIEAYLSPTEVVAVLVTARGYLPVNGAIDAIQISATTEV